MQDRALEHLRCILRGLYSSRKTSQSLAERARIVEMSLDGLNNHEQARLLGVDVQRVRRWRRRWGDQQHRFEEAVVHGAPAAELKTFIEGVLSDAPRSGVPPHFSAEQYAGIIALACERLDESGLPLSHWSSSELAQEAVRRGIVESISPRHVGRILNEADIQPHKVRGWLTSPDKEKAPEQYQADVEEVCRTYLDAPSLLEEGVHVVSTDEKTGIQALQRKHPTLPVKPGLVERQEFEYIRHGTCCLIAAFDVATGKVFEPTIGPTRTEEDFAAHIARLVDSTEAKGWIFVADQLNTHMSESLVRVVAERCGYEGDLGVKGTEGILATMASRKAFLTERSHRIRFVYTPRHCSWLNQVEIWFSILVRKLLRRGSFKSLEDLQQRLVAFIDYFNDVLAKPFRWTYTGRPLHV